MKLLSTLAALLVLAAIITATVQACKHRCTDTTHYTCDGVCSCDGLECN